MTKIDRLDRRAVREAGERILQAAKAELEELGLVLTYKGGNFTPANAVLKFEIAVENGGQVLSREAEDFQNRAVHLGLHPDDLGAEFTGASGERFRITGYKSRAKKYPILAERVHDGRKFKFSAWQVIQSLKAERSSR